MQHIQTEHMHGTVLVPTSGAPRFLSFYQSIEKLKAPQNSRLLYGISADIVLSMNNAMDNLVGDWLFIVGDDHTFHPDILLRLLSWGLPAVVGLNVMRVPPYWPVILEGTPGPELRAISWDRVPTGKGLWYPPASLYPGDSGLLLRKSVISRLEKPYIRAGQFSPGIINEDIWLIHCLKQLGVMLPIDLGAPLGHSNNLTAVPIIDGDVWRVAFQHVGREAFRITPKLDQGLTSPPLALPAKTG